MQQQAQYTDVSAEVFDWLLDQAKVCQSKEIILDPGIGFAKTAEQSLRLIKDFGSSCCTRFPHLMGASRKSFIGHTLNRPSLTSDWPALAAVAASYSEGAKVSLRS